MDKKELKEFTQLKKEVRRLEQIVGIMARRLNILEKQNRTLRTKVHQTGLDMAQANHNANRDREALRRGGPYNPPGGL